MRKIRPIILLVILVLAIGALQAYREYHRPNKDLADEAAVCQVRDDLLIRDFQRDEQAAGKKYLGKVVAVEGIVKEIRQGERGQVTLALGKLNEASSVNCAIDSSHSGEMAGIRTGRLVILKGLLIGFNRDETGLLGSDVVINRCILVSIK